MTHKQIENKKKTYNSTKKPPGNEGDWGEKKRQWHEKEKKMERCSQCGRQRRLFLLQSHGRYWSQDRVTAPPPPPPPPHPEGVTLPLLESPSLAATVPACLCGRRHAVCASQRVKQTGIGSGVCVCAWTWLCLAFLGAEMGGRLGFKMTIWQKTPKKTPKKTKPWWTGRKSIWKCLECLFFFYWFRVLSVRGGGRFWEKESNDHHVMISRRRNVIRGVCWRHFQVMLGCLCCVPIKRSFEQVLRDISVFRKCDLFVIRPPVIQCCRSVFPSVPIQLLLYGAFKGQ